MSRIQNAWNDVVRLAEQSTLTSGIISLCLVVTCCYMYATGQDVPAELVTALMTILAFFFGAKSQKVAQRT